MTTLQEPGTAPGDEALPGELRAEHRPHFGYVRAGRRTLAVHLTTLEHLPAGTGVQQFNTRVAVGVTRVVSSMWCAYVFALIALLSLPAVLTTAGFVPKTMFPHWLIAVGLIALVAWIAQTFLQLVLLSIIMVGQDVQNVASDARAAKTFDDTESVKDAMVTALDRLDCETEGGIKTVLDRLAGIEERLPGRG